MAGAKPVRVRVRMYQVGFGDCFLVSFEYTSALPDGRSDRHVLIDFGSSHGPRHGKVDLPGIAHLIQDHTNGHLDVVVVTHRHKDHLSAFGHDQAAKILSELQPGLVVRPWTEDPDAPADAQGLLGRSSPRFAAGLQAGQAFAESLAAQISERRINQGLRGDLGVLAKDQVANPDAVQQLNDWAANGDAKYVCAGGDSGIAAVVPGVKVSVLGPPTIEQWAEVATQRAADPDYWMLYQSFLQRGFGPGTFTADTADDDVTTVAQIEAMTSPGPIRWLAGHLRDQEVHSLTRLVRALDDALNNTSIILLFEIGERRLLFPGDAQIENWHYTLNRLPDDPELQARLSAIDLYKVGHHGSRNATPRSLYKLWCDPAGAGRAMTALMSTRAGVHGRSAATRVPRQTLVNALEKQFVLLSTDDFSKTQMCLEVAADLKGNGGFEVIEP